MCNIIKNKYHPNEFLDKKLSICNYTNNNIDIDINLIKKYRYKNLLSHALFQNNLKPNLLAVGKLDCPIKLFYLFFFLGG